MEVSRRQPVSSGVALARRLEEASLNAWPAHQQTLFDGWVLRFSAGYTKPANSVNPLYASTLELETKVGICEDLYAEKGLPTVFRLTPLACPPTLDQFLEARGYLHLDPTAVQHLDLSEWDRRLPRTAPTDERLDDWMAIFDKLKGSVQGAHSAHKQMVAAIPTQHLLASLVDGGRTVACGLGVLESQLLPAESR